MSKGLNDEERPLIVDYRQEMVRQSLMETRYTSADGTYLDKATY